MRIILVLAIVFVAWLVWKGFVGNVNYFKQKDQLRYFLNNQFSKFKLDDLPQLFLSGSQDRMLVSNGIYISDGHKSGEGIKSWRKTEHWTKDGRDFSYLEADLISFYAPSEARAFYSSEKGTKTMQFPQEPFKQKEGDGFSYYISATVPKNMNLEGVSPNHPGYASFLIIVKDNLFIGMEELSSSEKSDHKLNVLKQITPPQ